VSLPQFVVVLEVGVEAFILGKIPEELRLFAHLDPANHPHLDHQNITDMAEQTAPLVH